MFYCQRGIKKAAIMAVEFKQKGCWFMVPIRDEWSPFSDLQDKVNHYREWGLIPPKRNTLRPVMVIDGYFGIPEPCNVVGYNGNWAVIEMSDGFHAIYGEYLAEMQPSAHQRLPYGVCFAEILENYVVLDIETTGFNANRDRIIEIAAASYSFGKKISEFHSMVNPCIQIPPDISSLTGITQEDVSTAPLLGDVVSDFLKFIGNLPIVGHNISSFDIPFVSAQMSVSMSNTIIDTLPMARNVFPLLPNHKLEYLDSVLHLGSAGAHRAAHDVETTNALLWACLSPRKYESNVNRAFLDNRLSGMSQHKSGSSVCRTNPHKQKKLKRSFEKVNYKTITPSNPGSHPNSPLSGKIVVFTGELSISREDAMQIAVDAGAILRNSISGKTSYLVVGKQDKDLVGDDGMSSKEEQAHALNNSGKCHITIISEEEFFTLVKGDTVPV